MTGIFMWAAFLILVTAYINGFLLQKRIYKELRKRIALCLSNIIEGGSMDIPDYKTMVELCECGGYVFELRYGYYETGKDSERYLYEAEENLIASLYENGNETLRNESVLEAYIINIKTGRRSFVCGEYYTGP